MGDPMPKREGVQRPERKYHFQSVISLISMGY